MTSDPICRSFSGFQVPTTALVCLLKSRERERREQ